MKRYLKLKRKNLWKYCAIILLIAIAGCVYLDSVDQPSSAVAGEEIQITMHNHVSVADGGRNNERLVIALLLPKVWRAAENADINYTTTSRGSGHMVPVPSNVICANNENWPASLKTRFGVGDNYMPDDLEWVVFWSEQAYNVLNGENQNIDVQIRLKAGSQNVQFKPGYFLGCSTEGLSDTFGSNNVYKVLFKDCFEVTGGTGDVIDFCNPQLSTVTPGISLDNDFITVKFNDDVLPTALDGYSVYLYAKGITSNGEVIETPVSERSKLERSTESGKKYSITIWPRKYFNLRDDQTLSRMEYYFTDVTGQIKVGYFNSSNPFVFTFKCE